MRKTRAARLHAVRLLAQATTVVCISVTLASLAMGKQDFAVMAAALALICSIGALIAGWGD